MKEKKSRKATQEVADLEAIASWQEAHIFRAINQRKSYREGFVDGAKWMLEHPTGGELLHVCNKTAEITKKKMIDKACEWLVFSVNDYLEKRTDNNIDLWIVDVNPLIENFKKYIEEQL